MEPIGALSRPGLLEKLMCETSTDVWKLPLN